MSGQQTFTAVKAKYYLQTPKGKSIISHFYRIKLGLTMTEYVFVDFLGWWKINKPHQPITQHDLMIYTGIRPTMLPRIIARCKLKEVVTKAPLVDKKGNAILRKDKSPATILVPTEKWNKCFAKLDDFENFWKLRTNDKKPLHLGNRVSAQRMYKRLLDYLTAEEIQKYFLAYVAWCRATNTFQKHSSTWLNPMYEYWKDDLTIANKPTEKKEDDNDQIKHEIDKW